MCRENGLFGVMWPLQLSSLFIYRILLEYMQMNAKKPFRLRVACLSMLEDSIGFRVNNKTTQCTGHRVVLYLFPKVTEG